MLGLSWRMMISESFTSGEVVVWSSGEAVTSPVSEHAIVLSNRVIRL